MSMYSKKRIQTPWNFINLFHSSAAIIFMTLFLGLPSASAYSSDRLQLPQLSVGRNLLQAKKDCPIDIQGWNYTVITSQCRGPKYPAEICCEAFKELACPYARDLNDLTNNCATTMFSYINLYGSYPPGLFANICRDSHRGLECTDAQKSNPSHTASSSTSTTAPILTTMVLFFLPILYFFLI
ncbi:GPI-anchored protein LLG1 [Beta vulgaris subsp. vulgaris]|uniref:GPI-anchored protein LLG1 n=1 Tax=Beta vulgaris subsp. vulgaris TaxID=3555 RepID=UPI0020367B61|nr:GPI-anchored protein LLG1 [Beta vulgaris subsp. vulgaris]